MNCYFIRCGKTEENQTGEYSPYVQLSIEDKDKIYQSSKLIAGELKNKNGRVSIISEDDMSSLEVALVAKQSLDVPDNRVFVDGRLNARKGVGGFAFGKKSEKKEEYTSRIFDAITEIIMTHENDDAVIVVAGEHLFKTCQKDDSLHTLMYFGDEYLLNPLKTLAQSLAFNNYASSGINDFITCHGLTSRKEQKPFEFEKVILEAPQIDKQGCVKPVYIKYAEQKLIKEIEAEEQNNVSQKGE